MLLSRLFESWKRQTFSKPRKSVRRSVLRRSEWTAAESLETRTLLAANVLVVTNTLDSGAGSLRQAIEDANQSAEPVRIEFSIPGTDAGFVDVDSDLSVPGADSDADVFHIELNSGLPAINNVNGQSVTLDATTQSAFTGNTNPIGPEIELSAAMVGPITHGLQINSANVVIHGLVINQFQGSGIVVAASEVVIASNYIGVDATGTVARANTGDGIEIVDGSNILIGGDSPAARNVISGNLKHAIVINDFQDTISHVTITSNYVGVNSFGNAAIPNGSIGEDSAAVRIDGEFIRVGAPGAGNVISGNAGSQARGIAGGEGGGLSRVTIQSNLIGTDSTGTIAIGNVGEGIALFNAVDVLIGGALDEANLISGNTGNGIAIASGNGVSIRGNLIGTDITGQLPLGNQFDGVAVVFGLSTNVSILQNQIAFNGRSGVASGAGDHQVEISRNSIHSNGGLGIDLGNSGVTTNDDDDADSGTNRLQNFPVLEDAAVSGRFLIANYSVSSAPGNSTYPLRVEFFAADDDPNAPEGRTYLGSDTFTEEDFDSGSKRASFTFVGKLGTRIVATATDANGNTSEFSEATDISSVAVNLPSSGGPFNVLVVAGELHIRRANNSEAITPVPLNSSMALTIVGSNANDAVTLDASLNGAVRSLHFGGRGGNDRLNGQAMTLGFSADGGSGNDSLTGGQGDDTIHGSDGDDTLIGGNGNDFFFGGLGNDRADGSGGNDSLHGEAGNDVLNGGDGSDVLTGGLGNDALNGDSGADTLTGGDGRDSLAGGSGTGDLLFEEIDGVATLTNSSLTAASGSDRLSGFERILIVGGFGNDSINASASTIGVTLDGGEGNDTLKGGSGNDLLLAGDGDDVLTGGTGNDELDGGEGNDRLLEIANANLTLTTATLAGVGTDTLSQIESAQLTGGSSANKLDATRFAGPVTLIGLAGNDTLIGGSAADSLDGGNGNDQLTGNAGNDRFVGGSGTGDTIVESGSTTFVLGTTTLTGSGADTFATVEQAHLTTANSSSSIDARRFTGRTTLIGGSGNDTLLGGTSADSIIGGGGNDVLRGGLGNDSILGGNGDDIILGDAGDDSLSGSNSLTSNNATADGNDTILGGAGKDRLFGGVGNDVLSGEQDNDTLFGDDGEDSLFGGAGTDSPVSVEAPDTLSAEGVFADVAFSTRLATLLAALP